MKGIYNPKKLTTDRERFHKIRVLNIGAGAVGSAAVEHEAKLCLSLDVIDDDRFEPDNAAKRSCLVRTPEDDGSNKALCLGPTWPEVHLSVKRNRLRCPNRHN